MKRHVNHEQKTIDMSPSQVYEYAIKHGLGYRYCQPCDAETPTYHNTCLVCGSANKPEERENK